MKKCHLYRTNRTEATTADLLHDAKNLVNIYLIVYNTYIYYINDRSTEAVLIDAVSSIESASIVISSGMVEQQSPP